MFKDGIVKMQMMGAGGNGVEGDSVLMGARICDILIGLQSHCCSSKQDSQVYGEHTHEQQQQMCRVPFQLSTVNCQGAQCPYRGRVCPHENWQRILLMSATEHGRFRAVLPH